MPVIKRNIYALPNHDCKNIISAFVLVPSSLQSTPYFASPKPNKVFPITLLKIPSF
jgi:hypothetical protein